MIARNHRFHGRKAIVQVYQKGRATKAELFGLKSLPTPGRRHYRLAVIVSRKVNKSAVARNRIRRRLYAAARELEITEPHDIILTVYSDGLRQLPSAELKALLQRSFKSAGLI